ncbi:putative HRDC domain, 3'-5' exonuclease domain, HRDC-like superfamily, ribonuclease H superfamily [Helianthus annuus]|nr:putative HRDC domain, 3'-5' exonuclease domain, HRDC-like superfamily, ribonuclease H superfamily [Helianthus annuus]KAJ0783875.1 putative HRDC domain, 3'-5' exonuclease domain, HRDC-like superfamily, ribonuclease H superfamily [Helianthus annuus]
MQYCVDHPQEISKLSKVKAHVSEVKGVLDRGEKIEFPVDKTENLRSQVLLVNKGIDIDGSLKIIRFTYVFAGETFRVTEFIDKMVSDVEPMKPPPVESTFKLVQDVKDLKELTVKLCDANEFAVMHGADRDIIWLQRDFGIYVCNMFDPGQYLLKHFCDVAANKEYVSFAHMTQHITCNLHFVLFINRYQNVDRQLRLLTDMLEKTHYLLYIYDLMKKELLSSTDPNCPEAFLVEVYQRSYDLCMQLYQKEILTKNSYLNIYGLYDADLNGQQLAIVAGLCEWRDVIAHSKDESTSYILSNKVLIEIAKKMPVTTRKLQHLLKSRDPYNERNLGSIVGIIKHSMQNGASFKAAAKKIVEDDY